LNILLQFFNYQFPVIYLIAALFFYVAMVAARVVQLSAPVAPMTADHIPEAPHLAPTPAPVLREIGVPSDW
jgi:hypothetical protein